MKKYFSLLFIVASLVHAENWPQLRGPNGAGISAEKGIPIKWTAKDYAWGVKLPGIGHSSPIVWEDHVIVTSAANKGEKRFIQCFEAATGKPVWMEQLGGATHRKHALNSYASATPVTDGKRVFTSWGDNEEFFMVARDFKTGKELWQKQLGASISEQGHGTGVSPILFEDLVIILNEHDTSLGYIAALDQLTGKVRWKIDRKIKKMTYSTPILVEHDGQTQLINACLDDGLMGLDPHDGKILWTTPGTFDLRTVAMPVYWKGHVYGSCGGGGKGKLMTAVKLGGKGKVTGTHVAWERRRSLPYVPTPIAYGDHLYLWLDNGIVICVNPKTGEEVWNERVGRGDFSSSPVCVDGKIYCSSRTGEFTVIKAGPKYELLGRSQLGESTHATPAISNGRMFLRGFEKLYCLEAK
tara:strand:+ start:1633 stop:2865 length:1233 start_codon:yes stop_codon:yes gene_type:complete